MDELIADAGRRCSHRGVPRWPQRSQYACQGVCSSVAEPFVSLGSSEEGSWLNLDVSEAVGAGSLRLAALPPHLAAANVLVDICRIKAIGFGRADGDVGKLTALHEHIDQGFGNRESIGDVGNGEKLHCISSARILGFRSGPKPNTTFLLHGWGHQLFDGDRRSR